VEGRKEEMPDPQDTRTDPFIGRLLCDGEYHIQRVLGHGSMGKVFLAIHTTLRMPFVLKQGHADQPLPEQAVVELDRVLHSGNSNFNRNVQQSQEPTFPGSGGEHTDRFLREALLLARLEHPSIPTLYDYFAEDGYWYMAVDYAPGLALYAYLSQHAPLAPLEALNYAMQLCDVLDYLHQHTPPIIFCDLKPSNIILTPDGALMLVDFGGARYFKAGQFNDTTNDTTGCDSPGYAAPEQQVSKSQADMRSDLYSLGVILHEMLSGRRSQGTNAQLEPLHTLRSDISTALSGLVELAINQDPVSRFQSAHALYQALERVYSIEESRIYQHRIAEQNDDINASQTQSTEQAMSSSQEYAIPLYQQSETLPVTPTWTMNLELRRKIRERVQLARQEQQAKAVMLEQQFTSIDESLKWRAQLPLAPTSPPPLRQEEQSPRRHHEFPCALWIGFLLVMAILLVLASLLLYMQHIIPAVPLQ
jgi:serine/threonine protein kinase